MGVKVKCKECGNRLEREKAYLVENISEKTLKLNKKYYCNTDCYEKQQRRKELILKCNDILEEILNIPVRTNIYFNKMYSPLIKTYDYEVIYEFLTSEKDYIEQQLEGKDFNTTNTKIKYFLAIMQNKIDNYKDIVNNKNSFKEEFNTEIFDELDLGLSFNTKTIKRERSIEEILEGLGD